MGGTITVYEYWTWEPGEGLGSIAPAKRSLAEITALGGIAILTTAEEITSGPGPAEPAPAPLPRPAPAAG